MIRLLITGGCGHIGSYVIEKLSNDFNLTIVDNFLTQRYCSLFNLEKSNIFFERDFVDLEIEFLQKFDIVLHLAAITNASESFNNKEEIESVNVDKTKEFIEKCNAAKVETFIFPSSTSVYGSAVDVVYENRREHVNPQSPYAESKIQIEDFLRAKYKRSYLILRLGTIFGVSRGIRFHTAINKFCFEAVLKRPLTIWRDNVELVRPYLGLSDFTRCLEHCLRKNLKNEVYNVLTLNVKLSRVIDLIRNECAIDLNFVETPLLNQFSYEVSRAKIEQTDFQFSDSLEDGIRDTIRLLASVR